MGILMQKFRSNSSFRPSSRDRALGAWMAVIFVGASMAIMFLGLIIGSASAIALGLLRAAVPVIVVAGIVGYAAGRIRIERFLDWLWRR